jgi:hypothetical protein
MVLACGLSMELSASCFDDRAAALFGLLLGCEPASDPSLAKSGGCPDARERMLRQLRASERTVPKLFSLPKLHVGMSCAKFKLFEQTVALHCMLTG